MKRITLLLVLALLTTAAQARKTKVSSEATREKAVAKMEQIRLENGPGRGFVVDLHAKTGVSGLIIPKNDNNIIAPTIGTLPAWSAGAGAQWFFSRNFGIGTGVDFDMYYSTAKFAMGDQQKTEKESVGMVSVPLLLHIRTMNKTNKVGLSSAVGLQFAFPVTNTYQMDELRGSVNMKDNFRTAGGQVYGELGLLLPMTVCTSWRLCAYATYGFSNIMRLNTNLQPISGYTEANFPGTLATFDRMTQRPWSAGVKLSFEINTANIGAQREYKEVKNAVRQYDRKHPRGKGEEVGSGK